MNKLLFILFTFSFLSSKVQKDFKSHELLGIENNGNTAGFIANNRFDGILFFALQ